MSLLHKGVRACLLGRIGGDGQDFVVGFNFIGADRDQVFLLPPDMRDWLPADHLAWFVIDVVVGPVAVPGRLPGRRARPSRL
jgi:hypothetical protein